MIRHTAVFRLKHAAGSAAERDFLAALGNSRPFPASEAFEILRQVSPKNDFTFGVSMEFADQAAYQGYNNHPGPCGLCAGRWVPEVAAFTEIDYVALPE